MPVIGSAPPFVRAGVERVNALNVGVAADGSTDDRAAWNTAITNNPGKMICLPAGLTSLISVDNGTPSTGVGGGVSLNQARTMLDLRGATIQAKTTSSDWYQMFDISAADCMILGGRLFGDVGLHTGTTGEFGYAVSVGAGADRFKAVNVYASKCWGDGFLIWQRPLDVELQSCISDNNRRQGLSIIDAIRPRVLGGAYINTGATAFTGPGAGIDLEPDVASSRDVIDALVSNVMLYGNKGPGFTCAANGRTLSAQIVGARSTGNGAGGTAPGFLTDGVTSGVTYEACHAIGNSQDGFLIDTGATNVTIRSSTARANTRFGFGDAGTNTKMIGTLAILNQQNGYYVDPSAVGPRLIGAVAEANSQSASIWAQFDIYGTGARLIGCFSDAGTQTNKPTYGYLIRTGATGGRLDGCDVAGTFATANYLDQTGVTVTYPVPGAARAAAVTAPNTQTGAYVQADVQSIVTAVNAIRAALAANGITA